MARACGCSRVCHLGNLVLVGEQGDTEYVLLLAGEPAIQKGHTVSVRGRERTHLHTAFEDRPW
eukprot:1655496-Pleurochrysis_carterae.AAC.2